MDIPSREYLLMRDRKSTAMSAASPPGATALSPLNGAIALRYEQEFCESSVPQALNRPHEPRDAEAHE
jgi:hypothetical protein